MSIAKVNPTQNRVKIPRELLDLFVKNPQIHLDIGAPGYWPIPIEILKDPAMLAKLAESKEIQLVAVRR